VLEDRDEYISENVFWVPERARWAELLAAASQPDKRIDDALELIDQENVGLRNILPRMYARAPLSERAVIQYRSRKPLMPCRLMEDLGRPGLLGVSSHL
jgi:type I restriction-modification system DNA methylase subunit